MLFNQYPLSDVYTENYLGDKVCLIYTVNRATQTFLYNMEHDVVFRSAKYVLYPIATANKH